ncbi:extensin family protein [Xanthobacter autotrophicus]|uniref:extensin family protein n=1 Tax=Xanthobacter autotrophicus TaxID=280 RepID=UPI0037271A1D
MVATLDAPLGAHLAPGGSCGLAQAVRLSAVRLLDGRLVAFKPAAVIRCEVAAAVAGWLREDLAPAIAALGSQVTAVTVAASYDCRPRNRVSGARMSEHGLGNALDVGGFELADARVMKVEKGGLPPSLRAAMKDSACRRFTTVLGPGSDGYHEDHIHVDLAQRRMGFRLCRWNLDAGTVVARKDKPKPKDTAPAPAPASGSAPGDPATDAEPDGAGGKADGK